MCHYLAWDHCSPSIILWKRHSTSKLAVLWFGFSEFYPKITCQLSYFWGFLQRINVHLFVFLSRNGIIHVNKVWKMCKTRGKMWVQHLWALLRALLLISYQCWSFPRLGARGLAGPGLCLCVQCSLRRSVPDRETRLSAEELMLLNCGAGADSWEALGLQGHPTSPS